MSDQHFHLVAIKRPWIPERLYGLIVRSFWRPLCVRQPLRWLLHEEVREEPQGGVFEGLLTEMQAHSKRAACPRCGKNLLLCDDEHDTLMCFHCGGSRRNTFFEPFRGRLLAAEWHGDIQSHERRDR